MNIGQKVTHPVWGPGVITFIDGQGLEVSGREESQNGESRYSGNLNIGVKFDNGGPLGWAYNSTNDIKELQFDGN